MHKNAQYYHTHSQIHAFDTRNKNSIIQEMLRLSTPIYSVNYHTVKFYNILTGMLKFLPLNSFKQTIKYYLSSKAFFSNDEFLVSKINDIN